jgi:hypothetical protein
MAARLSGRAARIFNQHIYGPAYIEDADVYRIRQWGDPNEDWVRPEDVRAWLRNRRVVEEHDLRSALEYIRGS